MQQLTQKLKNGTMNILEVPSPTLLAGQLLVKNHYSLISAGTEGSTVKAARSSLLEKAKQRPQQVKQVIEVLKQQGPTQTYRAVMNKLDAYSPLGYSCMGEVLENLSGDNAHGIKQGDFVACGGLTACHAEIVSVPEKLCVKLHPETDFKQATYNTLGAIALQGVRQADLRLGESCAVIGLGLLGQLVCLLLRASGVRVVGVDIDDRMVGLAARHCADIAFTRSQKGIEEKIIEFTNGIGCDSVIITAASDSHDPINFAGAIARKKGSVVVVGAVPTGFDREPYYYKKELQVKMSCSYGPGRYDPLYEDRGIDYPHAYVRWTEKRNMEEFQGLILTGKIDVSYLTTHTFKLHDAPDAYDMMMSKAEPFIGIIIEYDNEKQKLNKPVYLGAISKKIAQDNSATKVGVNNRIGIGFVGAGSYAQSYLLPNIPNSGDITLKGIMTSTGLSSRSTAERYGFDFCTSDIQELIENTEINTLFISTRHDSHAEFVLKALQAGKNVFVEKPLCLTEKQLDEIAALMLQKNGSAGSNAHDNNTISDAQSYHSAPILMVGYNRRFSPFAQKIKEVVRSGPISIMYRINSGAIPADCWIQDKEIGGGRVIGEVCHFVDFLIHINGSLPVSVYANVLEDAHCLSDTLTVSLQFENGSIGTINYFANGDKGLSKELIEVYGHGCTAIVDDFKTLHIYSNGKKKSKKLLSQDKGQKNEVKAFLHGVTCCQPAINYDELLSTSWATFKILESIRTRQVIKLV